MNFSPTALLGGKTVTVKGRYSAYELQGVLGKGGSAVVYRAIDLHTHQTVAAKKITAQNDAAMHQWRTEVETLMTLKDVDGSRHVIRYLDHLAHEKTILLIEEFAANGSLQAHLRQHGGGFAERDVARLVHQITSGLAFIHSKDIVHRDLKCANALVCDDGQVKLSDFGLSATDPKRLAEEAANATRDAGGHVAARQGAAKDKKGEDSEDGEHPIMGSVYWMAPETIRGQDANPSSDIWSLGCLCIELLTGQPPFFDRSPISAMYHIAQSTEPVPLPDVPLSEAGRQFIQSCLVHDPSRRPTARKLLQSPWFVDVRVQLRLDAIVAQAARQDDASPLAAARASGPATPTASTPNRAGAGARSSKDKGTAGGIRRKNSETQGVGTVSAGPSNTTAGGGGGGAGPSTAAERTDSVGQWVETSLFSDSAEHNEAWARESLQKVILALPFLTPAEAHDCIRSFAYAAEKMGPAFVDPLGDSTFWEYSGLSSTGETPAHAAMMFAASCQYQSTSVHVFAPACPRAIAFLLCCRRDGVARRCVEAVHSLYCSPASSAGPLDAGTASQQRARQDSARRRLVTDGGLLALRSYLETECRAAFVRDEPPVLGWALLDRLFQVILAVLDTDGADAILWGGDGRETSPPAESVATMREEGEEQKGKETGVQPGTRGEAASLRATAGKSGKHKDDQNRSATAAASSATAASASSSSNVLPPPPPPPDARNSSDSAIMAPADGAPTSADTMLGVVPVPTERWYLAIQEASRSGVAPHAVELLIKLINRLAQATQQDSTTPRHPIQQQQQQQQQKSNSPLVRVKAKRGGAPANGSSSPNKDFSSNEQSLVLPEEKVAVPTSHCYVERAGVSLGGLLVSLACTQTLPDDVRILLLQCVPVLRGCSQRAATFLADEFCAIPLYAYLLTRTPAPALGGRREVLLMLLALCDADARVVTACAQSSLLVNALAGTLCAVAAASPRKVPAEEARNADDIAADLSLCLRLVALLRGGAPSASSPTIKTLAATLAQSAAAAAVLRVYASDAATPAEQSQLCIEILRLVATALGTNAPTAAATGAGEGTEVPSLPKGEALSASG